MRHDGRDGFGALQRYAEGDGRAVVEDVDGVFVDFQGVEEFEGCGGEAGEGVVVRRRVGHGGEAEAGEVRGDDVVRFGELWDQVAVLEGGAGEPVQEEDGGVGGGAGGAVED